MTEANLLKSSKQMFHNGSFMLAGPRNGQPLTIDEVVVVYQEGRQVDRKVVHSSTREIGRFKSKQRIPGLKSLAPGVYQIRLVFETEGRRLGQHEWDLVVGS